MGIFLEKKRGAALAHWAEPIIADEIFLAYEKILGGRSQHSESLANTHLRMCHFALMRELSAARTVRALLLHQARALNVGENDVNLVEQAVLRTLVSISGKNRLGAINRTSRIHL